MKLSTNLTEICSSFWKLEVTKITSYYRNFFITLERILRKYCITVCGWLFLAAPEVKMSWHYLVTSLGSRTLTKLSEVSFPWKQANKILAGSIASESWNLAKTRLKNAIFFSNWKWGDTWAGICGKSVGYGAPTGMKKEGVMTTAHPCTTFQCECPPPPARLQRMFHRTSVRELV